jgi:hypothetical protein
LADGRRSFDVQVTVHYTLEEMNDSAVKLLTIRRRKESGAHETRTKTRTIRITLTLGREDNATISLQGQGDKAAGIAPGDLAITIIQLPHQSFQRVGDDLIESVTLYLRAAIIGNFEIRSDRIDSEIISYLLTQIVQPGQEVKVAGRGTKRKDETRGTGVPNSCRDSITVARSEEMVDGGPVTTVCLRLFESISSSICKAS